MGLLDRIAADLLGDSIGLKPRTVRRMVRRAGGSRLIMMGGAALAGGLLTEAMQKKSTPAVPPAPPPGRIPPTPPPLPPLPTAAGLPPLPEPPATTDPPRLEVTLPSDLLFAVVRTMIAAALADGKLSLEERGLIETHFDDSAELDADQRARVQRDLVLPAAPEELATLPGVAGNEDVLYRFGRLVVEAQDGASERELAWLDVLAEALGLSRERRAAIEEGQTPLGGSGSPASPPRGDDDPVD